MLKFGQIIFKNLPIPPSINKQLGVRGGRLRKTRDAHYFDAQLNKWILTNIIDVNAARKYMTNLITKSPCLRVDCIFVFHEERIFTKTKNAASPLKTLDANNRLKSALDAVAKIINVDDKHFTTGICEKATCKTKDQEQMIVKIDTTLMRTLDEIK